jgi:hypothetical protein
VAELADAADSKSAGALLRVGSTPSSGTIPFCFPCPYHIKIAFCKPFLRFLEVGIGQAMTADDAILVFSVPTVNSLCTVKTVLKFSSAVPRLLGLARRHVGGLAPTKFQ